MFEMKRYPGAFGDFTHLGGILAGGEKQIVSIEKKTANAPCDWSEIVADIVQHCKFRVADILANLREACIVTHVIISCFLIFK